MKLLTMQNNIVYHEKVKFEKSYDFASSKFNCSMKITW